MRSEGVPCPQGVLCSRMDRAAGARAPLCVLCLLVHAELGLTPAEALAGQPR